MESRYSTYGTAIRSSWPTVHTARPSATGHVRIKNPLVQTGWLTFVGGVPWEWFVTLTFDPKKRWSVSRALAERETVRWCADIERYGRCPCGWMAALEQHKSGRWHAHLLLTGVTIDLTPLTALWQIRNGRADLQAAGSPVRRTLYMTKEAAAKGHILLGEGLKHFAAKLNTLPAIRVYPDGRGATSEDES